MRIVVDFERCEGHGLCEEKAAEVFSLDDDGELIYHFADAEVPPHLEAAARAAAAVCPVAALRVADVRTA